MLSLKTKRQNKVIETLLKLSSLFGSARDLAEAVEELGLFDGKAFCKNEGWGLDYTADVTVPYAYAQQGWALPEFGAILDDNGWHCSLGYGVHYLDLTFDTKTGELIDIIPDDVPSNWCWDSDVIEDRIDEVLNILGIIWFPFKIPSSMFSSIESVSGC